MKREERERSGERKPLVADDANLTRSCYDRCQLYITRSVNKQPITHLSVNNSQSEYAVRFLQSGGRVKS